ncbi:MAG: 1-phosphatidylinositol-3-phosphate 5-kinase [Cirrosporium novae-zelandiae]|nr:MAG: 1-phosphatidylinositol-3-phosphate 5-kinase [Cirrosporium novae-zelandiae]
MSSRATNETPSPSASFTILPLERRSRRGSIASLLSHSQADREISSQTLDQIHTAASQSDALTVFNEYTHPPPGTSAGEHKKLPGDLQSGLSGLYNRFRASVGGVKENVGVSTGSLELGTADEQSTQYVPHSPSSSRPSSAAQKASKSDLQLSAAIPTTVPKLQSPTNISFMGAASQTSEQVDKASQAKPKSTSISSKGSTGSPHIKPLAPLTKVTNPVPAPAALAEINVSLSKDLESFPLSLTSLSSPRDFSGGIGSKTSSGLHIAESDLRTVASNNKSTIQQDCKITPSLEKLNMGLTGPTIIRRDTSASGRTITSFSGDADSSRQEQLDMHPLERLDEIPHKTPIDIDNLRAQDVVMSSMSLESRARTDKVGPLRGHIPRISQSHLPGFQLSQATSSDAGSTDTFRKAPSSQGPTPSLDGSAGSRRLEQLRRGIGGNDDFQNYPNRPLFAHMRTKILSKEFWMKDENAKDCFNCGDTFSTFRRKHHCRICGQIFDAKCTTLISARPFGHNGTLRICKPCQAFQSGHDDDSSDFSDDETLLSPTFRLHPEQRGKTGDRRQADGSESQFNPKAGPSTPDGFKQATKTPTMAIPATRKPSDASKRKSAVLEIDSESPVRPSSSRSLKASVIGRPMSMGHRRLHSRHQHLRNFKVYHEERAPFHRGTVDDNKKQGRRLPAFHKDSIIDPDLAPYMSDDASTDEDQQSIFGAIAGDNVPKTIGDSDKQSFNGFLPSIRKGRSRFGDRASAIGNGGRDADDVSLSSVAKATNLPRSSRRRNLSIASHIAPHFVHRLHQFDQDVAATPTAPAGDDKLASEGSSLGGGSRMIRSASMRGAGAPPVELNNASLQHVRKLLRQLLEDSNISNWGSWESALVPILLQATEDVNPAVQHGDDLDIRHYVKLKKIPGGRPGDTSYVSGLAFTKNLALKSMPRSISNPKILIVTFSIEYARHQQHFMSLDPVIRQEREYLKNLVSRIATLKPQLLLVQKNVSGLALEYLQMANIATAYNVKPSVLEAVSRCSQTEIVSSLDKLSMQPSPTGSCASFDLKTYLYNGRKKTYMYLSGCPKELGCTIVLRGAHTETLRKIKRITEFMIYVVYNLKLETGLMRDEFALIPSSIESDTLLPGHRTTRKPISDILLNLAPPEISTAEGNIGSQVEASHQTKHTPDESESIPKEHKINNGSVLNSHPSSETLRIPADVPMPTFYGDLIEKHRTRILSASPFVQFMQPYLLMRAREQERRVSYLKKLRDQDMLEDKDLEEEPKTEKFDLIKPEMIHETVRGASRKMREVLYAVHDAEYDKALHSYETQKRQWETYLSGNTNLFDPLAHQNIAVLYSLVCTETSVPCSGPDIVALGFYNEHDTDSVLEADCTLGQYVEDLCYGTDEICISNGCESRMSEHHRQYVHGEGQITVYVQPYPSKLRGMQDMILMWSCCRICGNETQVMPMSDSTWKYSFGKYLELSFWSKHLHARAGICPHDLHRDHLRYFGFRDMALRIQYDSISLLEIIVPRTRVTWKVDIDLKFRNEIFLKYEDRLNRFMRSVKARLESIHVESVLPEKAEACKLEIEKLMKKANEDHTFLIGKLRDKYMDSKYYEIIPFNRALRAMQEKVFEWETAFTSFENDFFPSEKDIRRLATLQLKKIFLDRDASMASLTSTEGTTTPNTEITDPTNSIRTEISEKDQIADSLSPEKTQHMLASVVEEHSYPSSKPALEGQPPTVGDSTEILTEKDGSVTATPSEDISNERVQHLDLAIPSSVSEKLPTSNSQIELHSPAPEVKDSSGKVRPSVGPLDLADIKPGVSSPPKEQGGASLPTTPEPKPNVASGGRKLTKRPKKPGSTNTSPPLIRAHSQPLAVQWDQIKNRSLTTPSIHQHPSKIPHRVDGFHSATKSDFAAKTGDKKFSDRFGLSSMKSGKNMQSGTFFSQRSNPGKKSASKVSTLAKHFEQLSREFEKERIRERKQRAARGRPAARPLSMASSRPIIQVYKNVHDAVEEREPSDEDFLSATQTKTEELGTTVEAMAADKTTIDDGTELTKVEEGIQSQTPTQETQAEDLTGSNRLASDADVVEEHSEEDHNTLDNIEISEEADGSQAVSTTDSQLETKLELPKHERSSLMKMLSNFWAERSASGWKALEYPLNVSDHVFADCDIVVREDEPSSLIAFALDSDDYKAKLASLPQSNESSESLLRDPENITDAQLEVGQFDVEQSLLRKTGTHLKYQFQEGSAKMLCKIFYAEQFEALRRKCGVSERIVESLSRCLKWDSKGGKTKSLFLKTLDERLVLKSLSAIETQAFLKFAPAYFQIMSETLFHELPSVIAKMLGFYQIIIKNPQTGVEFNSFLLLMENLFYDRTPTRIFDLKGSMRNRKIQSTGEKNEVLLDENMVEFIYESPLFTREHSKKLLRNSVYNDTLFLERQNVMDYSLMVAIDENRKELVVGIIDCIRTYTWDKKLETWIKDRGKNRPTVTSPKEYKSRFREAMARYVLQAPNCWHQFTSQQMEMRGPYNIDNQQIEIREPVRDISGDRTASAGVEPEIEVMAMAEAEM